MSSLDSPFPQYKPVPPVCSVSVVPTVGGHFGKADQVSAPYYRVLLLPSKVQGDCFSLVTVLCIYTLRFVMAELSWSGR